MFWRSLSIPGRKAPRLHFRWEWIFCNPFTWKMHCDEKPKLALRSETKRKTFGISFVIFLYFFCYLFVFLLLSFCISLLSFCISFYNPFTWNIHFYEKPKLALRSETKRKTFCMYFVISLYFFCYLFVFLFIIPSHETCISLRNQSLHCDQRPKGRLFVLQHLTSQGRKNTYSLYKMMI